MFGGEGVGELGGGVGWGRICDVGLGVGDFVFMLIRIPSIPSP